MRIALASDHRGVRVRQRLHEMLLEREVEVIDLGSDNAGSVDYPDYAQQVGELVAKGEVDRGILICGTGLGMCIAANKIPGVRATPVHDDFTAELSRRHNDSNVLCLSADLLGERLIDHIVDVWLKTQFEGGRHARRVEKIRAIEQRHLLRPEEA
jgi:ribose 5-phosphate isomerase B